MNSSALSLRPDSVIVVGADRFSCDDSCRQIDNFNPAIEFNDNFHPGPNKEKIFWGPYIGLPAGVYLITIEGQMVGSITFDFVCDGGRTCLKMITTDDLSKPLCLVLINPVQDLEIRAWRTRAVRSLTINSVSFRCAYLAAGPDESGLSR